MEGCVFVFIECEKIVFRSTRDTELLHYIVLL